MGNEADAYGPSAYYEEQELSHRDPYTGSGYPMNLAATPRAAPASFGDLSLGGAGQQHQHHEEERRGRSRDRDGQQLNPFDDAAEPSNISMRGVSPRPVIDTAGHTRAAGSSSESPTERKSVFRENV